MKVRRKGAATITDIGRELGVSAMTVSRALNGHPDVHEDTRLKVLRQAERLRYRPNRWARSLVTRTSHIIGIVVPDISHSFFSEITRTVQETLERRGYDLMLCHYYGDIEREQAAVEMLLGSRIDGLIVASGRNENDPGIYAELQREGVPFVLLDRFFPALECARVRTDDAQVGRLATEYLLSLGHRRIGHLLGPAVSVGRLRAQGYRQAMAEAGVPVREEWTVQADFSFAGGYRSMQQMLASPDRPTAVFATNDPAAFGAREACQEAGLLVPRDMSLVGAGRIEGSFHIDPFFTSVDWSRQELGEKAATALLTAIEANSGCGSGDQVLNPTLVVRRSTAPPATA